ncbi:MAG: DUF4783 domain-containing protein [Candidatus Dadabacteria bacterium]
MFNKIVLSLLAFFLIGKTPAPLPVMGLDDVVNALRSGNATELARYVDDNIELSLPDKTDTYSRAQAVLILQDFFANNGIRSFEVKHKGNNGGSEFCIGTLITRSGNYRTTVFMASKNGKQLLREIRFQST